MKKVGDFWLPDMDLSRLSNWGKNRRKTLKYFGRGEGPKTADIRQALSRVCGGKVALDGGAHVGAYTRLMLERFDTVYAFEPAPDTFAALARNLQDWGVADRVHAFQQALSDRRERVGIKGRPWHRSVSRRVSGRGRIEAVPIDELGLARLDFMKLDLEGYEYRALQGARQTLVRCRPWVLIEEKPHKSGIYDEAGDAGRYLMTLGAELACRLGKRGNDWLYRFPREAGGTREEGSGEASPGRGAEERT